MDKKVPVSVDRDFARFGAKSYAINKINTVEVRERHPYGLAPVVLFGAFAFICLFGGSRTFVFVLIFGALAFWAWRRSRIVEYQLFLMTSSSEAQAITSKDSSFIGDLRSQIEKAMAGQLA